MAQQTAVEWLQENCFETYLDGKIYCNGKEITYEIQQAKQMEKEQTIAFTNDYITNVDWSYQGKTTAQYYNEKYSK